MISLTWVVEDSASAPFKQEHGYAVWIESPDGVVLFDTGGSGEVLLHNLSVLDLDPQRIDAVVVSHAHDDHTGGLPALSHKVRRGIPLYAQLTLFRDRFAEKQGIMHYRGIPVSRDALTQVFDLKMSREPQQVLPGIWTSGDVQPRPYPEGRSPTHFIKHDGAFIPDPYEDDLSIVIDLGDYKFILCGCCHAGLLNTMAVADKYWDKPLVGVAGGTHLNGASEATLSQTVQALEASSGQLRYVWLGHCSGEAFMQEAETSFGDIYRHCKAGQTLRLGD